MKRAILLLALLWPPAVLMASSKPDVDPAPGTYACIAHRVVGLQNLESGDRYAGKIKLRTEGKNFLITITRLPTRTATEARQCARYSSAAYWTYWDCKTSFELKFSKGKISPVARSLRGDDTKVFRDVAPTAIFWFGNDLGYFYHYNLNGIANFAMEEGICQKMEVPK